MLSFFSLVQPPKVYEINPYAELLPNASTVSGISSVCNWLQPAKLAAPIETRLDGKETLDRLEHPLKAPADIVVIDVGREILVILQQLP